MANRGFGLPSHFAICHLRLRSTELKHFVPHSYFGNRNSVVCTTEMTDERIGDNSKLENTATRIKLKVVY